MIYTKDIWVTTLSEELYVDSQTKRDSLVTRLKMTHSSLEKLEKKEKKGVNIATHNSLRAAIRATKIALIFLEENMMAQGILPYR